MIEGTNYQTNDPIGNKESVSNANVQELKTIIKPGTNLS